MAGQPITEPDSESGLLIGDKRWISYTLPTKHGRELHAKPKFLVTAKARLSATFSPNISDFFDLYLHCWALVVPVIGHPAVNFMEEI